MKKKGPIVFIIVLVVVIGLSFCVFTVDQTKQAIVIQLGRPLDGVAMAGLHFKVPFIQQVEYFENRIVLYDATPTEILTKDKKNLVVDNYTKWKIENPLRFYKTVRTEAGAQARLDDIVYAQLRVELGQHDLSDIVSTTRGDIMHKVTEAAALKAKEYGIQVVDVRIKRADLPEQNEKHVFGRMKAERERQARQYRSEGEEESKKITAKADMERTIILAKAYKQSEQLKGEGDAEAIKIYAHAYEQDVDFFEYFRSLEAYKKALNEKTKVVVTPDIEFFKHIK